MKQPQDLLEAIRYFSDLDIATEFVAKLRWPAGPTCPECGGKDYSYLKSRRVWKCKDCKKQYSVKVGSIFEGSPLGFDKWLPALWMVANCKNGISSHEMARSLGVTQKSAWFMLHRIRLAMQTGTFDRLSGDVEVDETFIGGKARNMHIAERKTKITGTGGKNKTAVLGVLERGGEVRASIVPDVRRRTLHNQIHSHVEPGRSVYSDAHTGYSGLGSDYAHKVVDHAEAYVDGQVHTNGLENFWSLLKRGLHGTYISVEPFHLFRYLDEQVYRYNTRHASDSDRFLGVLSLVAGRGISYKELIGKA